MLIYLCSSSHGFGHAARDAAVLQWIHKLRPDWHLAFSSVVQESVLRCLLAVDGVELRRCRWDVGMVQQDALGSDPLATIHALEELERQLPVQLDQEVSWIVDQGEPVLVLADIPPAAAELAKRLEAPLIWLSNFGWDEIYAPFGGTLKHKAEQAKEAYQQGDLLLRCPFDLSMGWGLPEASLGLVCASPRPIPRRLKDRIEAIEQPLVMVGFGGLGLSIDDEMFLRWPQFHFLVAPSGLNPECSNVTVLPEGVRPLDLFPYCQRHLGKPGFSTFCEAMSQQVGLHVVERRDFAEVPALLSGLRRHGNHRLLSRQAFAAGDWKLDQPLQAATDSPLPANGALQAAEHIVACAEQREGVNPAPDLIC